MPGKLNVKVGWVGTKGELKEEVGRLEDGNYQSSSLLVFQIFR
jgi:hypothetical protein